MFDINRILDALSVNRPVFRLEKDFQEALYDSIRKLDYYCEKNKVIDGVKVDLYIEEGNVSYFIQLRHKTRSTILHVQGEEFKLKTHGAQDQGRYDYFRDLHSLERIIKNSSLRTGYSILLTNDHLYWEPSNKQNTVDKDFLLNEGRKVTGTLDWKKEASNGTKKGRDQSIELSKEYIFRWNNYSSFIVGNDEFRYLCVEV